MSKAPEMAPFTRQQARRIRAAWRGVEPTRAEVRAAHLRFMARNAAVRRARRSPLVLVLASLFLASASFAAAAVVRYVAIRIERPSDPPPSAIAAAPAKPARHGAHAGRSSTPHAAAEPDTDTEAETESETETVAAVAIALMIDAGAPELVAAPSPDPTPAPSAPSSPLHPPPPRPMTARPTAPVASVASAAEPAPPPAPTASAASAWVVAAEALRSGDYPSAERAFDALAHSTDPRTRDEARLARAQVQLAEGRERIAIPDLEDLEASASSPLVKQRALDALQTARKRLAP